MIINEYDQLPKKIQKILEIEIDDVNVNLQENYLCLAVWREGARLTSCNADEFLEIAQEVIDKADGEENYGVRLFDMKTGKQFKIKLKEVELEEV
jgi:hypothetical protein